MMLNLDVTMNLDIILEGNGCFLMHTDAMNVSVEIV